MDITEQENLPTKNLTERPESKSFGFWIAVIGGLVLLTQLIRVMVLSSNWSFFLNDKFAFSLNFPTALMYVLYITAMVFIVRYLWRHWQTLGTITKLGFVLILSGGVSNFGERMVFGHVVDYIFIANGVLNAADLFIMFGILSIFIDRPRRNL
ncbi:MAG TPA: signal peptidase II [Candidatus Doudnabacteria bacterium]|nr:signal peptidase II [Candidatus Doudnabacteria bacterium]